MQRGKRNWSKEKYIRLLMIFLAFYNLAFASPSLINIEYFPKVANISDIFTIKFYMDSRLRTSPKIILNDNEVFSLETSNMFIENGNSVIENQYKINKTGLIKLEHILLYIEDKVVEASPIELEVKANLLSKDTQFRIRIFRYDEDSEIKIKNLYEHNLKLPFILGEKYFILIEGLFEKTDDQKVFISKCKLQRKAFLDEVKTYPEGFRVDETWKSIAMFLWIPLKKGMQPLPIFNLVIDISKTQEYKLVLENPEVKVLPPKKSKIKKDSIKEDFQNKLSKAWQKEEYTFKQNTKEEIDIANGIKELRGEERNSFFYLDLKKRRIELEKELGLEDTFAVFHYKLYVMSIVIAIMFLCYPIYTKIAKKKFFYFYSILSFCTGVFILIYGIMVSDFRKEYTVANRAVDCKIYITPDINSTVLENISIGQTVKIIHASKDWMFVETRKNIKGWIQKKEGKHEI